MGWKCGSVAALCRDFAPDTDDVPLPGHGVPPEIVIVLAGVGFGHQRGDVPPENLAGRIAEQALGRGIERFETAPAVDQDDRVNSGFDDGAAARLAASLIPFGAALGGL